MPAGVRGVGLEFSGGRGVKSAERLIRVACCASCAGSSRVCLSWNRGYDRGYDILQPLRWNGGSFGAELTVLACVALSWWDPDGGEAHA
jgi:hypothetical protein